MINWFNGLMELEVWGLSYWGNSVGDWVMALGVFVVVLVVLRIVRVVVLERLAKLAERSVTTIDDKLLELARGIRRPIYYLVAVLVALQFVVVSSAVEKLVFVVIAGLAMFYIVQYAVLAIDYFVSARLRAHDEHQHAAAAITLLSGIAKIIIWTGGGMLILGNIGVDVTSLIAGLGIGGIAVALALQGVLKDLFASFSLLFDKPFTIGDFIDVGDNKGTVQKIGIKTTRLKSLSGEEIIIPNQDLTSTRVHNYKRMSRRRVAFSVGVIYETPQETLQQIAQIIQEVIENVENVKFSRAHFSSFDDWALTFDIVYFVNSRDYELYMDAQQTINFAILEKFAQNKIEMAYPTKVVYSKSA